MIKKIKQASAPVLSKQTLQQFSQLKQFIDSNLKEAMSKNFETDEEKVKYLHNTLLDLRDFMLAQITENSLRINLINQFNQIEAEELEGNSHSSLEEKLLNQAEESLEQNPLDSKMEKEVKVESTTDS